MKKSNFLIFCLLPIMCLTGCSSSGTEDPKKADPFMDTNFVNGSFVYDGQPHSIYVTNAPKGSLINYTNNDQVDVGTYIVSADITLDGYPLHTYQAELTITEANFSNVRFVDANFEYDGQPHSLYAEGVPEFAVVTYTNNDKTEIGTYNVTATISAPNYSTLTLNATLTINEVTFKDVIFEDGEYEYDGEAHSLYAEGVPEFATITYTNNGQTEPGTYTVTVVITAPNYISLTKTATLTIKTADMNDVKFEDISYIFDGKSHSIEVKCAPTGSTITYRRTNGSGNNTFTDIGEYVVEATVSCKNYNSKVLTATLSIKSPLSIITVDPDKTPLALDEPLMWDPIFNELMNGNYTLFYHSGYWDESEPDVMVEKGGFTVASDGTNCFTDTDYQSSSNNEYYHSYHIYTNCGDDVVDTDINNYGNDEVYQSKFPAVAMNETVILKYVASAFVSLQKDESDGSIIPGIDLDDYYSDEGRASVKDGRFVVTMQHPRKLDNGEKRYFYEIMEFYNIGNTKLDIPSGYFLDVEEINELELVDYPIYIDGVTYDHRLKSTWNSPVMFIARTMMLHYQQLIVKPGVHYVLPKIYDQKVERVVYNWYTEQILSFHDITGYELNLYFDEDKNYRGEFADLGTVEMYAPRFTSDGGIFHYYDEWNS